VLDTGAFDHDARVIDTGAFRGAPDGTAELPVGFQAVACRSSAARYTAAARYAAAARRAISWRMALRIRPLPGRISSQ
jgi:hypothetical protein